MTSSESYRDINAALRPKEHEAIGMISRVSPREMGDWMERHTQVSHLGECAFRAIIAVPDEGDASRVIAVTGEYANGLTIASAARARQIREAVDPSATLVMFVNDSFHENNLGFTGAERFALRHGDPSPYTDRMQSILDTFETRLVFGPSQGATTAAAYAARDDVPPMSVAVLEAPNVVERTKIELLRDFVSSGKSLKHNIAMNGIYGDSALVAAQLDAMTATGTVKYGIGAIRRNNRAILSLMSQNSLPANLKDGLTRGSSVVHSWAKGDMVSPRNDNHVLARRLRQEFPLTYRGFEIYGEQADHSITNVAAVCV